MKTNFFKASLFLEFLQFREHKSCTQHTGMRYIWSLVFELGTIYHAVCFRSEHVNEYWDVGAG